MRFHGTLGERQDSGCGIRAGFRVQSRLQGFEV